jgi:putative transposase
MGVGTNVLFKNKYRIESTRLKGWDYAKAGYYFVTICVKNRRCILGNVVVDKVRLSPQGSIVKEHWYDLPNHYRNCRLDEFIVMPNHIHGIIEIRYCDDMGKPFANIVETGFKPVSTKTTRTSMDNDGHVKRFPLWEIIRGFETFSAIRINKCQNTVGRPFWQPQFYDHIVRNEKSLNNIRRYIQNNPLKWSIDKYNPDHKKWRPCEN